MPRYFSHQSLNKADSVSQTPETVTPSANLVKADPALAMLEFSSIAQGMVAADKMVKKTVVDLIHAGTVQPGHYLVVVGGVVAEVEEALKAGKEAGREVLTDFVWLPNIHRDVLTALHSATQSTPIDTNTQTTPSLGIIETKTAPAAIQAGDIAAKGATIQLFSIRLSDGLGGKGLVLLIGSVSNVEAAIELVNTHVKKEWLYQTVIIPQLHDDFAQNVFGATRFFR